MDRLELLKEMGIETYHLREKINQLDTLQSSLESEKKNKDKKEQNAVEDSPKAKPSQEKILYSKASSWQELSEQIQSCKACPLHQQRKQAVVGSGNNKADLMIVGEAPGANEDEMGLPFVGRSGKLLDSILFAVGLNREQIYIANIIKCRPLNNRNPEKEEMDECEHFLNEQIAFIDPKLIVTLGAISSQYLLKTTEPMGKLRQKIHKIELDKNKSINLIASYHPAYLLRDPMQKAKAWQDWKMIRNMINPTIKQ